MIPRILQQALRHQRRFFGAGHAARTRLDRVQEKDKRLYGGLKSWDILTSESQSHAVRDMTKKPLWHIWQLATASAVPIALILYLEHVETTEREQGRARGDATNAVRVDAATSATSMTGQKPAVSPMDLEQRLERLERQMEALRGGKQ